MFMLFGFLVVAAIFSLPDLDSVGRKQNQNAGKKDGGKEPGGWLLSSEPPADAQPSEVRSRNVTLVT